MSPQDPPPHADRHSPLDAELRQRLQGLRLAHRAAPAPTLAERREHLRALQAFAREQREALCQAISADYGHRSRHETLLLEVAPVVDGIAHVQKHLAEWMKPQRRSVDHRAFPGGRNRVIPQPLGVVGVIVPWNFPINLSLVPLTYILAAGNRAMVKMSERSARLASLMIEQLPRYLPSERVQVLADTGGVGEAFSRLPFDHLLFTGSSATGRQVMAAAAANLCPVTLELGGQSPAVVAPDFPLRAAAERILFVKCLNAGQICTTVDHAWLPQERIDEFTQLALKIVPKRYPSLGSPDYSSIIDATAFQRLLDGLDEARQRGASVLPLLPGPAFDAATRKIAPHLVVNAPDDCALMRREIFGPILPLRGYHRIDEVIHHINAGERPLALYPFSHDADLVERLITEVMSGGVTVNDALLHVGQHELPFGGVGASGMGHYHGREGFDNFSKLRPVFHQGRIAPLQLMGPPFGRALELMLKLLIR